MPPLKKSRRCKKFLSLINYLAKFMPYLATSYDPFKKIDTKRQTGNGTRDMRQSLMKWRKLLLELLCLSYYGTKDDVILQCDSSEFGLSIKIIQQGQAVCYASWTFRDTENWCTQIEKEYLAILFASKRFNQYIVGRKDITMETNHQLLEIIFRKPQLNAPKCLQWILLRLQIYA